MFIVVSPVISTCCCRVLLASRLHCKEDCSFVYNVSGHSVDHHFKLSLMSFLAAKAPGQPESQGGHCDSERARRDPRRLSLSRDYLLSFLTDVTLHDSGHSSWRGEVRKRKSPLDSMKSELAFMNLADTQLHQTQQKTNK